MSTSEQIDSRVKNIEPKATPKTAAELIWHMDQEMQRWWVRAQKEQRLPSSNNI